MVVKVVDEGGNGGDSLVEDGDAAQRAAGPLVVVHLKGRVHRVEERAHEGSLP